MRAKIATKVQSTVLAEQDPLSMLRGQAAFVRALFDEVERIAPPGCTQPVNEQFVEELARLGCRFLEAASALRAVGNARHSA